VRAYLIGVARAHRPGNGILTVAGAFVPNKQCSGWGGHAPDGRVGWPEWREGSDGGVSPNWHAAQEEWREEGVRAGQGGEAQAGGAGKGRAGEGA